LIGRDVMPPAICSHCRADEMGCAIKLGLGGRRCCDQCDHDLVRRDGEDLVRRDLDDAEDLLDRDDVQHGLRDEDHHDGDGVVR
jgi:hypothetical protein